MNVDYVIKMGGSIMYDKDKTIQLLRVLAQSKNKNIVYTIGSGYLGEVYKKWANDSMMPFDNSAICWSNIQSINANIIASMNQNFIVCDSVEKIYEILKDGKRPIVDARGFHKDFEHLEQQTTDVRSAEICHKLGCKQLVIITDIDGIYTSDPKKVNNTQKLKRINAEDLVKMGRTSVDKGLAEKLIEYKITGYVVGINNLIKEKEVIEHSSLEKGTIIEHE